MLMNKVVYFGLFLLSLAAATRYSVLYDKETNSYKVTAGNLRDYACQINYIDDIENDGWGKIKIVTSPNYDDYQQAYCAGYGEGYVETDRIGQHMRNIRAINFGGNDVPEGIDKYLKNQISFIRKMIAKPPKGEEKYWHLVSLMMKQLEGIVDGYNAISNEDPITFQDLYMHNADGDMETLLDIYGHGGSEWLDELECSALVRMREDGEIIMGHATWRNFAAMLRHYKFYEFHYAGEEIRLSFAASPGFINSKDDFYVNGHGIGAMETTNGIYDEELYKYCIPETVPSFIRSQVSNMMARDPKSWVDIFEKYNSGTYNNQWMAIDLNGAGKPDNIMWIVEQIPGTTIKEDVTPFLYKDGYWASYNIPYIPEIYEKSGYSKQPPSPDIDYYNCSRHNIFKRDAKKVQSIEDFKKIMRQNNYKNDPLAEGNPKHVIASRYDLYDEKPRHFGAIDSKITSTSMHAKNMGVWIVNGPTLDGCPAFSWSEWMKTHTAIQHEGHPDVFDFDYIYEDFMNL